MRIVCVAGFIWLVREGVELVVLGEAKLGFYFVFEEGDFAIHLFILLFLLGLELFFIFEELDELVIFEGDVGECAEVGRWRVGRVLAVGLV